MITRGVVDVEVIIDVSSDTDPYPYWLRVVDVCYKRCVHYDTIRPFQRVTIAR